VETTVKRPKSLDQQDQALLEGVLKMLKKS